MRVAFVFSKQKSRELPLFLGLFGRGLDRKGEIYVFNLRRFLQILAIAIPATYLAAALTLWVVLNRDKHTDVGFTQVVFPWNWDEMRRERGKAAIARSREQLENGNWGMALFNLRVGLARYPEDVSAWKSLAGMYADMRRLDLAEQTLVLGLESVVPDRDYLHSLFSIAHYRHNFSLMEEQALALLDSPAAESPSVRAYLEQQYGQALIESGRFEQVLEYASFLATQRGENDSLVVTLRSTAYRNLGMYTELGDLLQQAVDYHVRLPRWLLRELVLRDAFTKDASVLGENVGLMLLMEKRSLDSYFFALGAANKAGEELLARQITEDFIRNHGSDLKTMVTLAQYAADLGLVDCVDLIADAATKQDFAPWPFQISKAQALAVADRWQEAYNVFHRRQKDVPDEVRMLVLPHIEDLLGAMVFSMQHEVGTAEVLVSYMNERVLPPKVYLSLSQILAGSGRLASANAVLQQAVIRFPVSEVIRDKAEEVREQLLAVSPEAAQPAQVELEYEGAEEALAALDGFASAGQLPMLSRQLRQIQHGRPAWFSEARAELALRQVLSVAASSDPFFSQSAVRYYLSQAGATAEALQAYLDNAASWGLESPVANARAALTAVTARDETYEQATLSESGMVGLEAFQYLDRLIEQGEFRRARTMIQQMRRDASGWTSNYDDQLALRQLIVSLRDDNDSIYKRTAIRGYLGSSASRAARLQKLADDWADGELTTLSALIKEELNHLSQDVERADGLEGAALLQ